ncbi:Arc family DNA-binding protein [Stenotrophomonas maltophilia]|nr:Arc family DNA-binding protein [Stenotrophomonas maltophilia]
MSRSDPQINLRIPESLKASLTAAAKASGRSVNAEIVQRLIQTFEGFDMAGEDEGSCKAHFKIRLEHDLLQALKTISASNKRSVTAQIEQILAEFVAAYQESSK